MAVNIGGVNESGVSMVFEDDTINISGSIDCLDPGAFMSPFLNEAHEFILEKLMKEVKVDIVKLNFLNSSGIKEFVEWIMKLEFLPEDQRYSIVFICNHEYLWQEPSIRTLAFLNPECVKMELN
jgi:hypothetical protein